MLAHCLLLIATAAGAHRARGRGRGGYDPPSPPPGPPVVDPGKLTVMLAPEQAGTFLIGGDRKDIFDVGSSISYARLVVLVNSAEYDGPDLDFNASVSYSVDGAARGPCEPAYKVREANELQVPPPPGMAPGGARITALSWSYESSLARNSICVTVNVDAFWVGTGEVAAHASPVERCFSLEVTSVEPKELVRAEASGGSSSRGRERGGGGRDVDGSGGPFVRPSPAGLLHAHVYEPHGARVEVYRELLVAPSSTTSASLLDDPLEIEAAIRILNPTDTSTNGTEWIPLHVTSEGVIRRNELPDGPPFVRLYSVHTTRWFESGERLVAPQAHVVTHVRVRRGSGGETTKVFKQHLCTRLNSFACEWSAAERAPADNAWAGALAPLEVPCDRPPTPEDVERTAKEQGAVAPFVPLSRVRSLLIVEYDSPGGVFVSCERDMVRREAAPAERFHIDPFLGLQLLSPWSVRSAHLARYGCNTTESLPADPRIPVGELPAESCLGSDNYAPSVKWAARDDRLYTLMAWVAPQVDTAAAALHWLVVDIRGSDLSTGVELQRYIGPLPMRAFEDLQLVSIAVFEQPQGATFANLPIWPALGLGDSLVSPSERLGPAPVSAQLLVDALGLSAGPHAFTWFFTNVDLWVPFALQYIYGDATSAASVCAFDQVNHIVNPVGGYCTNGFYAAPENSAAPFEYLRFDDNGMNAITLDSCAARGFHYPVLEAKSATVNQSAIRSTTVVPSGKTVRRYGRVLIHCDPAKATWTWLGAPFCDGQIFSFPRYEAKRSQCDWSQLLSDASSGRRGWRAPAVSTKRDNQRKRDTPAASDESVEPCMDAMSRCHAAQSRPDVPYDQDHSPQQCKQAMERCAAAGWQLAAELIAARKLVSTGTHAHGHTSPVALALACTLGGALLALGAVGVRERLGAAARGQARLPGENQNAMPVAGLM